MAGAIILNETPVIVRLSERILSGTVSTDGTPSIRHILVYKNKSDDVTHRTTSDLSGNWAVNVVANDNDVFAVVAVGESGEQSIIFNDVIAG